MATKNPQDLAKSFAQGVQSGQVNPTILEKRFSPGGEFFGNVRRLSAVEQLGLKDIPENHNRTPSLKKKEGT